MEKYERKNYTEQDYKFLWKREAKSTGRWAAFDNNDLRGYNLKITDTKLGKYECGFIINVSQQHFVKDDSKQWQIWYHAKGRNIAMKKRFDFGDLENAKAFATAAFVKIMNSEESEVKDKILEFGRINKDMY